MKPKVIDDFLKQEDHEVIRNTMMSNDSFQWQFADGANYRGDGHHMFCHVLYAQFEPRSQFFPMLMPIINEFEPISIVRIKANLTMQTPERIDHGLHTDVDDCITSIYYVNSNDGYTRFEDGTKVDSIANRMVVFDSNTKHAGCTPTDTLRRCVINFNYFI